MELLQKWLKPIMDYQIYQIYVHFNAAQFTSKDFSEFYSEHIQIELG